METGNVDPLTLVVKRSKFTFLEHGHVAYQIKGNQECRNIVANIFTASHPGEGSIGQMRKRAKIRNRFNQATHLTQDTNGKVTTSQLDITNESQEVSPFPAGDHKASTNRRA